MSSIGPNGFALETLAQRIAALRASSQEIFGPDINLDPNSIDGETLGVFAESSANLDLLAQTLYQSFDPAQAMGAALSRLVTLNGIDKMLGTFSLVALTCTGTAGTVISAGSLVNSADGSSQWVTLDDATIGDAGTVVVSAACTIIGPVAALSGTLTVRVTVIYGWQTVTNATAAIPGTNVETDEALRARRNRSTATPSQAIIDGIYGAILNIQGVTDAVFYENSSDELDGNGLPAHSFNLVVQGGAAIDIATAIWLRIQPGPTQVGAQAATMFDSRGNPHVMRFDVPTEIEVYVIVNGNQLPGYPTDGDDEVAAAIVAWVLANLGIGDEVVQSALYTPINTIPGVSITSVFIGTAPAPSSTANIAIAFNAIAAFDPSRITVNIT